MILMFDSLGFTTITKLNVKAGREVELKDELTKLLEESSPMGSTRQILLDGPSGSCFIIEKFLSSESQQEWRKSLDGYLNMDQIKQYLIDPPQTL